MALGTAVLGSAACLHTDVEAIRWTVALVLVIFLLHMWDLHLDPCRGSRLRLRSYMVFLADYAWSVARSGDDYGARLSARQHVLDAGRYVAEFCIASAVMVAVFRIDWRTQPFLLEHAVKSTCLGMWIVYAFQANTVLWRLAGAPAAFFMVSNILGACSPADFWRRWNRPMHRWLLENVFKPLSRWKNPRVATLATFAVSGLLHEYLFAVALRRVTGYVTVFFLLQGAAVLLTRRFKPAGWLVLPAAAGTFAFNTVSTVLLLIPVNERVSFYVNDVPRWANPW
ncbi:MAG: MBOAT family O-acyltransferase [Phycisphaerales bacterium]